MSKWTRANPLMSVPGYNVPRGHFANGYTNGGDRVNFRVGGRVGLKKGTHPKGKTESSLKQSKKHAKTKYGVKQFFEPNYNPIRTGFKKGGSVKKNWIQDVNKSIKKRGTKGKCTPITKKGCTGRAKALAKTFKKMAKKRKS